jgi:hypothetical protein
MFLLFVILFDHFVSRVHCFDNHQKRVQMYHQKYEWHQTQEYIFQKTEKYIISVRWIIEFLSRANQILDEKRLLVCEIFFVVLILEVITHFLKFYPNLCRSSSMSIQKIRKKNLLCLHCIAEKISSYLFPWFRNSKTHLTLMDSN